MRTLRLEARSLDLARWTVLAGSLWALWIEGTEGVGGRGGVPQDRVRVASLGRIEEDSSSRIHHPVTFFLPFFSWGFFYVCLWRQSDK